MRTFSISKLAKEFGLSRSTLLYYDRIGLLSPSGRTSAGYRCYGERDHERLARICRFRDAGLSLKEIEKLLEKKGKPNARVLERRLAAIGGEMRALRNQERLLAGMLQHVATGRVPAAMDKATWVAMLRAAGMDDEAMRQWHVEFERRAPEAHHDFLLSLGIEEREVARIREWSAKEETESER